LRQTNGGTAPASTTSVVASFVAIQSYLEMTTEILGGRGNASSGQAVPVQILNSPAIIQATAANLNAQVVGPVAHDGVASGNPVRLAGRALTANYTAVASGDVADLVTTLQGMLVTRPWQIPELEWSYAALTGGIINTTAVALKAAAGAGLRNYITSLTLKNANAVAGEVLLLDGATVIWRGHLSASMVTSEQITFADPLKTTANAALNFQCVTTGQQVYVNAQGFVAV